METTDKPGANNSDSSLARLGPSLFGEPVHNTPAIVYSILGAVFFVFGVFSIEQPAGTEFTRIIELVHVFSYGRDVQPLQKPAELPFH